MNFKFRLILSAAAFLASFSLVQASLVVFGSDLQQQVSATASFTLDDSVIKISVVNTTNQQFVPSISPNASLTSFGFKLPSGVDLSNIDTAATDSTFEIDGVKAPAWKIIVGTNNIISFDGAFGVTGNNPQGGSPNDGLFSNGSILTVDVTFNSAAIAESVYDNLVDLGNAFAPVAAFRMQRTLADGSGSTAFTGTKDGGPTGEIPVPEPSTYGFLGAMLLALMIGTRRLRSRRLS